MCLRAVKPMNHNYWAWVLQLLKPAYLAAAAKSLQSCPTLWDPIDSSPPGSPVPGILQARTLEWVVISFSNALKWKVKVKSLSRVRLLATSCTAAHQAPPSMGFSRQEYWSGVPLLLRRIPYSSAIREVSAMRSLRTTAKSSSCWQQLEKARKQKRRPSTAKKKKKKLDE